MTSVITVLKALADETRFRLLVLLLSRDLCGRELARRLEVSEAAVSQHLKVLKNAGLVVGEKRGYWVHYSVERRVLQNAVHDLNRLARQSKGSARLCHGLHTAIKGDQDKDGRTACQCACECPESRTGNSGGRVPKPISEGHGGLKSRPRKGNKREEK